MKVGRSRGTESGEGGKSADQAQDHVNPTDIPNQTGLRAPSKSHGCSNAPKNGC